MNGKITLDDAYAVGMGAWDLHTMAYGYQDYTNVEAETAGLALTINAAYASGMRYKSDPDSRSGRHPGSDGHLWDNGADAIAEFKRIAEVRELALSRFGLNTIPNGTPLSSLEEYLAPLYFAHRYQTDAVVKLLGGIDYQYEIKTDQTPMGQRPVSATKQQEALETRVNALSAEFLRIPDPLSAFCTPQHSGYQRRRPTCAAQPG